MTVTTVHKDIENLTMTLDGEIEGVVLVATVASSPRSVRTGDGANDEGDRISGDVAGRVHRRRE
jgi:hypothetical protein